MISDRVFDRIPSFDPKSRNYQVRTLLNRMPVEQRTRGRGWTPGPVLDQGREGACVGYGCVHRRNGLPRRPKTVLREPDAFALYRRAQDLDEWPGSDYEGTSVLAGMKAGKELGWWNEYRWIGAGSQRAIDDLVDATVAVGPVILGINWLEGMFTPRPSGLLDVSGPVLGGHCVCVVSVRLKARLEGKTQAVAVIQNSWGHGYGVPLYGQAGGFVFIKLDDLELLLNDQGEGAVPVEL